MGLRRGLIADETGKLGSMGIAYGTQTHTQPYVYTNPTSNTIIRKTDLLYVLCNGSPSELGLTIALFDYTKKRRDAVSSVVFVFQVNDCSGKVKRGGRGEGKKFLFFPMFYVCFYLTIFKLSFRILFSFCI